MNIINPRKLALLLAAFLSIGACPGVWAAPHTPAPAWQFIKLHYVDPQDVLRFVKRVTAAAESGIEGASSPFQALNIRVGPLGNGFIVAGNPDDIRSLRAFVGLLDQPPAPVRIRVRVLALNNLGARSMGFLRQDGSSSSDPSTLRPAFFTRTPFSIETILNMLVQRSDLRVVADRIVVSEAGHTQRVSFDDVWRWTKDPPGLSLDIWPWACADGYFVVDLGMEYNHIVPSTQGGASSGRLESKSLNIRVKNGNTVCLGQVVNELEAASTLQLPTEGEVPAAGPFLKRVTGEFGETHVVVLITLSEDVPNASPAPPPSF